MHSVANDDFLSQLEELPVQNTNAKREIYLDYLRVLATFSVMVLHVCAQNFRNLDVNSADFKAVGFYESLVRWGVPCFVMISGSLFLPRTISVKKIFSKYILRLLTAFLAWGAFYACFEANSPLNFLIGTLNGHYQMWFIPMIIGIYLAIPLLQAIIRDPKTERYYLLISVIFCVFYPGSMNLLRDLGSAPVYEAVHELTRFLRYMDVTPFMGYAMYFVLGNLLHRATLTKWEQLSFLAFGTVGCIASPLLTLLLSVKWQAPCVTYFDEFSANVFLQTVALFALLKYLPYRSTKLNRLMAILSEYSFGAFLAHAFMIEALERYFSITTLSAPCILSVPVLSVVVFLLSFGVSAVLHQIPVVKKYLV